ncbi:hypothetical protein CDD82_1989 [Ophiocordyceps australis]|uniref:Peptidase A1 domain-containing protein n=1 Tax=Ophiocordyceps australis TaxID=1399860 RepID=A0A2C5Y1J6_9HYPO|nr:hypothetical protein CDD82_1989 [Ophiocordyceps australis]
MLTILTGVVVACVMGGVAGAVPAALHQHRCRASAPEKGAASGNSSRDSRRGHDWLVQWTPLGFVARAGIGSPRFEHNVFVDWTWIGHIVTTPRCFGQWNAALCFYAGQVVWDPRSSVSWANLSGTYGDRTWQPNHFFRRDAMHVDFASDEVQVGPVSGRVVLQLTDLAFDASKFGAAYPFTGVFGMSPVFPGDDARYQSPFYQQWKHGVWHRGLAGFVYCHDPWSKHAVCKGHDGIQTLGGIRRDLIAHGKIWWYRVKVYPDVNTLDFVYTPPVLNYWAIELQSLRIGPETQRLAPTSERSGKGAIFDHASYGRGVPLTVNAYARLVALTGGKRVLLPSPPNNGAQDFYAVDCSRLATFPTLAYRFVGHAREWTVTPQRYVETTPTGTCVLNVRTLASRDEFIGNFGETFIKDKYIVLDFERNRLGIADVAWPLS